MVPLWVSRGGGGVLTVHVGGSGTSGLVRLYLLNFGFCIPRGGKINIIESSLAGSVSSLSALGEVPAVGGTPPNADEKQAVVSISRSVVGMARA